MKTLNLDALAEVKRTITLGGETYPVVEMTVENFIETTKAANAMEGKDVSLADQMEASVAMISRSIPSCPIDKLRKLNFQQLTVVSSFIRGGMDGDEADKPAEGEGGEKN